LQTIGGFGFVKLSMRSPKDAVFEKSHPTVERILTELLTKLVQEKTDWKKITDNDLLIILTQACNAAMKITSGKEATALLCSSDRVVDDLRKAKEYRQNNPEEPFPKLVIRAWSDIPLEYEFRGFVCKKQLNALSQYFHYLHLPKLVEEKEQIQSRIVEYWETIKDLINHESYVIDFGILVDGSIKIIEINPFHYGTVAPFFGWKKGSEGRNIVLNGPFTFRIRTEPMTDARERFMAACWDKFFQVKAPKATSATKPNVINKTTTNNNNNSNSDKKKDDCSIM